MKIGILITGHPPEEMSQGGLYDGYFQRLVDNLAGGGKGFFKILEEAAAALAGVELRFPLKDARKVLLDGEIYVRKDEFTSQGVVKRLAEKDIIIACRMGHLRITPHFYNSLEQIDAVVDALPA